MSRTESRQPRKRPARPRAGRSPAPTARSRAAEFAMPPAPAGPPSLGRGGGQLGQIEVERGQQSAVLGRVDTLGKLPVDEVGSGVLAALPKNGDDNRF